MGYLTPYGVRYAPDELDECEAYPPMHLRPIVVGVDVGKRQDYTAIAVTELEYGSEFGDRPVFRAWQLQRLPLGTSYPDVAATLVEKIRNIRAQDVPRMRDYLMGRDRYLGENMRTAERRPIHFRIDSTGVGQPILDLIAGPLREYDVRAVGVDFVTGEKLTKRGDRWSMGKEYLLARLQVTFQGGRIKISPNSRYREAIEAEMESYEARINAKGRVKTGAFRAGEHDDLLTALGLAAIEDLPRPRPGITMAELNEVMYGDYGSPWGGGGDPYGW